MSFSKRAVHTLEGNETAIGVTDCHAYVDGQIACLSQGTLDGSICFASLIDMQFFIITRAGGDRCTAEFRLDLCQLRVRSVGPSRQQLRPMSALPPIATKLVSRNEVTLCAMNGLMHCTSEAYWLAIQLPCRRGRAV
jgi:hypothetical protein